MAVRGFRGLIVGCVAVFVLGACTAAGTSPGGTCAAGEILRDGLCVRLCNSDTDCGSTEFCESTGVCTTKCGGDSDCQQPPACRASPGACDSRGACQYATVLTSGPCDDDNPCTTADACGGGGVCGGTPISCPLGQSCTPANGQCEDLPGSTKGEICDPLNDQCEGGLACNAANSRCCDPGEVCCGVPADCPASVGSEVLEGAVCDGPTTCTGHQRARTCVDNTCGFTTTGNAHGACAGETCAAPSCNGASFVAEAVCDSTGGSCPSNAPQPCANGFACEPGGTACFSTCGPDVLTSLRCADNSQGFPDKYCAADVCEPLKTIGVGCADDLECLSGVCDPGLDTCRGAPGEACTMFAASGDTALCAGFLGFPSGFCWYGDEEGRTGKCYPSDCIGFEFACTYWEGDAFSGDCTGEVQAFTYSFPFLSTAVCFDTSDGNGVSPHEWVCLNGGNDDGDENVDDSADPDCSGNQPVTVLQNSAGRGTAAACNPFGGQCTAGGVGVSQCTSGKGGCQNESCLGGVCFPASCPALTDNQALCKYWEPWADLDDSCDVGTELINRPAGASCGHGCACDGNGNAVEVLCDDSPLSAIDNDLDGLTNAADPDCNLAPGSNCHLTFIGTTDQCAGGDFCWCANAACTSGKCIDDAAPCAPSASNDFWCHYYTNPTTGSCGSAGNRPQYAVAWPPYPGFNPGAYCNGSGGFVDPAGAAADSACTNWYDCASGFCLCANASCTTKSCWNAGDQSGNLCRWQAASSTAEGNVNDGVVCGGLDNLAVDGFDLNGRCACFGGEMREIDCDNGINDNWPADLGVDWWDGACFSAFYDIMHDELR